jgi:hypothetical protein
MVQDNTRQLSKEFLSSLLSNAEHDKEKTKVAKLKAILQAEYMKKLWPKLRNMQREKLALVLIK